MSSTVATLGRSASIILSLADPVVALSVCSGKKVEAKLKRDCAHSHVVAANNDGLVGMALIQQGRGKMDGVQSATTAKTNVILESRNHLSK